MRPLPRRRLAGLCVDLPSLMRSKAKSMLCCMMLIYRGVGVPSAKYFVDELVPVCGAGRKLEGAGCTRRDRDSLASV